MDIHSKISYPMGYETPRNPSRTRITQMSCCSHAPGWQNLSVRGRNIKFFHKFSGALGPKFSERRSQGASGQARFRPSAAVGASAEAQAAADAGTRTIGCWIRDGFVDTAAHFQADPQAFRNSLSPRPYLAVDGEFRMDVAEAGAPRHATGRESHRPLEEARVDGYKKKLEDLVPISLSSTKAGFSSSLMSARPGHQSGRPPSSGTAIGGIGFPQSPPLRYPPRGNAWVSTSVSIARTSPELRSSDSCGTCFTICGDRWCCSGTVAPSINALSSKNSWPGTSGSMFFAFRRMRQRSIRRSLSGLRLNTLSPMGRPKISANSAAASAILFIVFKTLRSYCAPAFTRLNCHGRNSQHIHYLCESQ